MLGVLHTVDPYGVLGVARDASADEIRRAYRQAVLAWHPDRNRHPHAPDMFHAVQRAYEQLGDPARRRSYDFAAAREDGVRKLRFDAERRPDWVPPRDERSPLRFVVGEGWTSLDERHREAERASPRAAEARAGRRGWTRHERVSLAAALIAAVGAGVAIAVAPLVS